MKVATARAIVEASKEFGGFDDSFLELDETYQCPGMARPTAAIIGPLAWLIPAVAAAARESGTEFVEDLGRLHFDSSRVCGFGGSVVVY